ncbi:MAG: leucyl/phenylalanyl-tRNA--protein transferase [Rhodoferax sp.]|nr:leucyl/phenylalanyl-tRNA--protein transferase [Rhodoferax sp.]
MPSQSPSLPWLAPSQDFPPASQAWGSDSPAPGLLAAGGALNVESLQRAYSAGIFPWFSEGQPTLWWSPNPRMVLDVDTFRLHTSLKKTLKKFRTTPGCEIRMDFAFESVLRACSESDRPGQDGTWIVPGMIAAYCELHRAGLAHSVETWVNGELMGGLYCVALGKAVFGESMFTFATDASKIALAALVSFCRHHAIEKIDCQQTTRHLTSLGAREIEREKFLGHVATARTLPGPRWVFDDQYWDELLPSKSAIT